jgi:hypothetical protein
MDTAGNGPSSLLEPGDEAARGLLVVAPGLRGTEHHPGNLSHAYPSTSLRSCGKTFETFPSR